jgi:hypothetical protein
LEKRYPYEVENWANGLWFLNLWEAVDRNYSFRGKSSRDAKQNHALARLKTSDYVVSCSSENAPITPVGVGSSRGLRNSADSSLCGGDIFAVPKNATRAVSNISSAMGYRSVIPDLRSIGFLH